MTLYQVALWFVLMCLSAGSLACDRDKKTRWENLPKIRSATFHDANIAWLITERDGDLLITSDGGKSWRRKSGEIVGGDFDAVTFADPMVGWAVNHTGQIWKSADGGESWIEISRLRADDDWQFNTAHDIKFVDDQVGWIIETFSIWRTVNGGKDWRKVLPSGHGLDGQPTRGSFPNSDRAVVAATNGRIYRTKDRGENWEAQTLLTNTDFKDVNFITKDVGWLFGYVGDQSGTQVYKTTDGGDTWVKHPLAEVYIQSLSFSNENEGWATGFQSAPGATETIRGTVLRTKNGGDTWSKLESPGNEQSFDWIHFIDSQTGWLIGRNSIYRSDDGGNAWRPILRLDSIGGSQ